MISAPSILLPDDNLKIRGRSFSEEITFISVVGLLLYYQKSKALLRSGYCSDWAAKRPNLD